MTKQNTSDNTCQVKTSGIIKTENGHIEYYVGKEFFKDMPDLDSIAMISTKTNDGKLLLRLGIFDVANLIESLFLGFNDTQKYNLLERLRNA